MTQGDVGGPVEAPPPAYDPIDPSWPPYKLD
jgi:hypothetical protein